MVGAPGPVAGHPFGFTDTFWLQWHLTDACNLDCRHCYRERGGGAAERRFDELEPLVGRLRQFLAARGLRGRIQLCGGEPLLAESLFPVLRAAARAGIPCRVLSNGTVATPALAARLARAGARIVQVSLDGGPAAHDALRGAGAHARAIAGARALAGAGIEVTIAATLSRGNLDQIAAVVDAAGGVGARRVAFARLVPHGAGAALRDELLTAAEWGAAQVTMVEAARRRGVALVRRDPTFGVLDGPLDATSCGAAPVGGCAAGLNGLTVEPDGTVLPCRRLPIAIGNVFESDLDALWASPVLETLRDRDRLEGACGRCARRWSCGGCRAVAHAVHGRLMAEDPQCPARAPWPSRAAADARRRWYRFLRDNG